MNNSVQKLKKYQEEGFVFHGSLNPNIEILEPRKAHDNDSKNTFNNDTAVFASIDPIPAVLFATLDFSDLPKEISNGIWGIGSDEKTGKLVATIPLIFKPYLQGKSGYIYVMKGSDLPLKQPGGSWMVKSKSAVKPIDKVKVYFEDFEKIGGEITWS
jgi:hypothetical protein